MICAICKLQVSSKGISRHLKFTHNMTNKEYYDKYLKKPNEGICPMCGKETNYYNLIRGYNTHCSVTCSSLDPIVQARLKATHQIRYNVDVGFQTEKCIENSHTKQVIQQHKDTRLQNGWQRSKLEEYVIQSFNDLNITYKHNYKSILYPWKCDFYLPDRQLYIEINAYWTHGGRFFRNTKKDKLVLEQWSNQTSHKNAIDTWTIRDPLKLKTALKNKLNYVVLWNREQVYKFIDEFQNTTYIGYVDYNRR